MKRDGYISLPSIPRRSLCPIICELSLFYNYFLSFAFYNLLSSLSWPSLYVPSSPESEYRTSISSSCVFIFSSFYCSVPTRLPMVVQLKNVCFTNPNYKYKTFRLLSFSKHCFQVLVIPGSLKQFCFQLLSETASLDVQ